ncbi:uncharacterized protein AKAME5_002950700 [Lates japonicus]|uniref:Uncharacterized protein n=1 Tax=Lates japonicus TaxID=270547 RepID=A0AAD3M2R8_LATJO|nr:uncharacterized protein AKAME5_002950700 [Lates japonicus]
MALKKLLWMVPETPYSKPPPIHLFVVAKVEQAKVLSWTFHENTAKAAMTKKKNAVAAVTDGASTAKFTVFEELAPKVSEGNAYIIRGYTLRGTSPPYIINITKNTLFFCSTNISVSEELKREAEALLAPASLLTPLRACSNQQELLTVEGEVVEVS